MLAPWRYGRAVRVDDDADAVQLELVVALLGAAVEAERVLEAGAPAALDGDAQNGGVALGLVGLELADLDGRALGQADDASGLFDGCHKRIVAPAQEAPKPAKWVTL